MSSTSSISFAASTPTFSTPTNLGQGLSGKAQNPNIAAAGSCVYVTYPIGQALYVRSSSNNGVTLGSAVKLSTTGKNNFQRIWATGTDAYVTWEGTVSGGMDIYFSATTDCGVSWSAAKILNTALIPSSCPYLCAQPTLTAVGSNVYVTWTQQNPYELASCASTTTKGSPSCEDVYVVSSSDAGSTWGANHFFGNSGYTGGAHEPEIAASGSYVYLAWDDSQLYFSESTNNGATWVSYTTPATSENALVLNQPFSGTSGFVLNREPHVAASGSNVYVVWESNYHTSTTSGKESTWVQVSTNNGGSWLPTNNPVSFGLNGGTWLPIVYPSGSYVYAAWGQLVKGSFEAEFAHSSTGGTSQSSWSQNTNSPFNSAASSGAHDAQLAASGALVYDLYFAGSGTQPNVVESTDGGSTFGSPVVISQGTGATTEVQNDQPQIIISGSEVCATWLQSVSGTQEALYSCASSP